MAGARRCRRRLPGGHRDPRHPQGQRRPHRPGPAGGRHLPRTHPGRADRQPARPRGRAHRPRHVHGRDALGVRGLVDTHRAGGTGRAGAADAHPRTGHVLEHAEPAGVRPRPVRRVDLPRRRRHVLRLPRLRRGGDEGGPRRLGQGRHPGDPVLGAGRGEPRRPHPVHGRAPPRRARARADDQGVRLRPDARPQLPARHPSRPPPHRAVRRRGPRREVRRARRLRAGRFRLRRRHRHPRRRVPLRPPGHHRSRLPDRLHVRRGQHRDST